VLHSIDLGLGKGVAIDVQGNRAVHFMLGKTGGDLSIRFSQFSIIQ
jgi:hypothetical protein